MQKKSLYILSSILLVDLIGFAIIVPILPELLDYYLKQEHAKPLMHWLQNHAQWFKPLVQDINVPGSNVPDSGVHTTFHTTVLLGCLLSALYAFFQFLFTPIWGRLSDHYGRKSVLLFIAYISILNYLLWIFSGVLWLFLIVRMASGGIAGKISVIMAAVSDLTSENKRMKGMTIVTSAFSVAAIFGPAAGGLAFAFNLTEILPGSTALGITPFSSVALVGLVLSIISCFILHNYQEDQSARHQAPPKPCNKQTHYAMRFVYLCIVYFLLMSGFAGIEATFSFLILERLLYNASEIAVLLTMVSLSVLLMQWALLYRYADRIGVKKVVAIGIIMIATGSFIVGNARITSLFYVGLVLASGGAAAVISSFSALASFYASHENRGGAMGIFRALSSLARTCGPVLIGLVYFSYGSQVVYLLASLLFLLVLVLAQAIYYRRS